MKYKLLNGDKYRLELAKCATTPAACRSYCYFSFRLQSQNLTIGCNVTIVDITCPAWPTNDVSGLIVKLDALKSAYSD